MPDSAALDNAHSLPRRNWASIVLVLFVQAMNSFSDNFVKMLLIALSIIIAKDSWVGRHMELWLGAIFSLPYMIFAPLAGYWSDRFSKRKVIIWMQREAMSSTMPKMLMTMRGQRADIQASWVFSYSVPYQMPPAHMPPRMPASMVTWSQPETWPRRREPASSFMMPILAGLRTAA